MGKDGLEVLARMTDSKIQVRDVVDKWLLLTYDLPNNDAGNKARQLFLIAASAIGATRHTDSVYLMPWSPEAEKLALDLAKTEGGEVIAWSQATPLNHAEEITANYDAALKPVLKEISVRLDKMDSYSFSKHQKRVLQMIPKTEKLIQNADAAIERRGAEVLAMWLEILKGRFAQIVAR
jgi:hypothetical protein